MKTTPKSASHNTHPKHVSLRRDGVLCASPVLLGLMVFLFAPQPSFAAQRASLKTPPALNEALRPPLGKICVVTGSKAVELRFDKSDGRRFDSAEAAIEGTGGPEALGAKVAEAGLESGGKIPIPNPGHAIVALGLAIEELAPLGAIVGATGTRQDTVSSQQLSELEGGLARTMKGVVVHTRLRDDFITAVRERTGRGLVVGESPNGPSNETTAHLALAKEGIQTMLEVSIANAELRRFTKSDTSFGLVVSARVRLIQTQNGMVPYDAAFEYKSGSALFLDWTLNHGEAFRRVFETASRRLAEAMVEALFLQPPPLNTTELTRHPGRGGNKPKTVAHALAFQRPGAKPASPKITYVEKASLRPESLANLGRIGIISTSTIPKIAVQRPLAKAQAMHEAREDAARILDDYESPLVMLANTPARIVIGKRPPKTDHVHGETVLGPITEGAVRLAAAGASSPIAVGSSIGGQVIGVARGLSVERLGVTDAAVTAAVREISLQEALRAEVLRQTQQVTTQPIVLVKKPFPPRQEHEFSTMSCVMAGTLAWVPEGRTPASYLASQGIDTVLEIQLLHPALNGAGTINPPMTFHTEVRVRLVRVRECEELGSFSMKYRSAERKFTDWASNNAQPLRKELESFSQVVAATIVDQLSLRALLRETPVPLAKVIRTR